MANLLSVNGKLESMNNVPGAEVNRSTDYTEIKIGEPLVVRYLYFFLNLPQAENKQEEVMISSFVKTKEEKHGAAEAINYYNPETPFKNGQCSIATFGGMIYSHKLCYYTKSYQGESIRMTTKIMELDKLELKLNEISDSITSLGALPLFIDYLPYVASAKSILGVLEKLWNFLDKDDPIIPKHDLDMYFKMNHESRLQSGRVLCVHEKSEDDIIDNYHLDNRTNRLLNDNKEEYTDTSYFVVQIDIKPIPEYEKFDYYQGAAELLSKTNRNRNIMEFVDIVVDGLQSYNDITTIKQIEKLEYSFAPPEERVEKAQALYKNLSDDFIKLYQNKFNNLIKVINPPQN
ncbi:MAG: hypothetical protein ACYS67_05295 [Planctomycetota bacterium]|jgi:hypothetical protein